jgi:transcriptional regulator with XRE-family HTH domain
VSEIFRVSKTLAEVAGARIRSVRESRGITLGQLVERMSDEYGEDHHGPKTIQALSDLERGKRKDVGVNELATIAVALGHSPLSLLLPEERQYLQVVAEDGEFDSYHAEDWMLGVQPLGRAIVGIDPRRPSAIDRADPGEDRAYYGAMPRRTAARDRLPLLHLLHIRLMELEVAAAEANHVSMQNARGKLAEVIELMEGQITQHAQLESMEDEQRQEIEAAAEAAAQAMAEYAERMSTEGAEAE